MKPSTQTSNQLVEHFFRHESANLVSVLTRVFGFSQLQLVEDTVQSALLEALEHWKINGIPDNPAAWVHRVAKNKTLDALRRKNTETKVFAHLENDLRGSGQAAAVEFESLFEPQAIEDSLLRMMFACCHPNLDRHSQIALTLKILCGFGVREIASALLMTEEGARKRVYRAKSMLAEANVGLELPSEAELSDRVAAVNEVLYLMFNEGYQSATADQVIREDVCEEACRLCHLLCQSSIADSKNANGSSSALLALMLYHAARLKSRTDDDGGLVMLEDQDRGMWDQNLIGHANHWLNKSSKGKLTTFHLEAAILQTHCRARSFSETDWTTIVKLYDRLMEIHPTPIYQLNRAIAVGASGEIDEAIDSIKRISDDPKLKNYFLLDCTLAHLFRKAGQTELAIKHLNQAMELAKAEHEKALIRNRIREIEVGS
jgi:RNA polymerase sigma-70 factor (ECF subfamily)